MTRRWFWLQLLIGWLPIWALFVTLLISAHPEVSLHHAVFIALRMIVAGAALGLLVQALTQRLPWPHPLRPAFVAVHLVAAGAYAGCWVLANSAIESVVRGHIAIVVGYGLVPYLVLGVWLYVMVAGVSYAAQAAERAARIEAAAARARLAALRAQLNPHFLFNALHTVVQLIPREPRRAAQAAEQVAALLRTAIEEDRDVVPLAEELAFVERYLDIERIRFGERLRVRVDLPDIARDAQLPSFALQTLVENAVRHGAAPRVEPTEIAIAGRLSNGTLRLSVQDTGAGAADAGAQPDGAGTGLSRLRDRLAALYVGQARLDTASGPAGGFTATLTIPQRSAEWIEDRGGGAGR